MPNDADLVDLLESWIAHDALRAEVATWAEVVKASGARADE